jgi:hypothetical protein
MEAPTHLAIGSEDQFFVQTIKSDVAAAIESLTVDIPRGVLAHARRWGFPPRALKKKGQNRWWRGGHFTCMEEVFVREKRGVRKKGAKMGGGGVSSLLEFGRYPTLYLESSTPNFHRFPPSHNQGSLLRTTDRLDRCH